MIIAKALFYSTVEFTSKAFYIVVNSIKGKVMFLYCIYFVIKCKLVKNLILKILT